VLAAAGCLGWCWRLSTSEGVTHNFFSTCMPRPVSSPQPSPPGRPRANPTRTDESQSLRRAASEAGEMIERLMTARRARLVSAIYVTTLASESNERSTPSSRIGEWRTNKKRHILGRLVFTTFCTRYTNSMTSCCFFHSPQHHPPNTAAALERRGLGRPRLLDVRLPQSLHSYLSPGSISE